MKKNGKLLKVVLYSIMSAIFFFGGWTIRESHDRQEAFLQGYETATNHIAHTIRNRMLELKPFYVSDIGIRFIPRGSDIVTLKYLGNETDAQKGIELR
jgi:hypothetical protein